MNDDFRLAKAWPCLTSQIPHISDRGVDKVIYIAKDE
jgi:hypothetical protein